MKISSSIQVTLKIVKRSSTAFHSPQQRQAFSQKGAFSLLHLSCSPIVFNRLLCQSDLATLMVHILYSIVIEVLKSYLLDFYTSLVDPDFPVVLCSHQQSSQPQLDQQSNLAQWFHILMQIVYPMNDLHLQQTQSVKNLYIALTKRRPLLIEGLPQGAPTLPVFGIPHPFAAQPLSLKRRSIVPQGVLHYICIIAVSTLAHFVSVHNR